MPILDPIKLGITPCKCGRLSTKLHCSKCGSYVIRGLNKKNTRTDSITLEQTEYQVYRCRVCFVVFDNWEWKNDCQAPPFETHSSRLQQSLQSGNPEEIAKDIARIQLPKDKLNTEEMRYLMDRAVKKKEVLDKQKLLEGNAQKIKNGISKVMEKVEIEGDI